MEHVNAEKVVSEALEYTIRCIKEAVDEYPHVTDVKHVQQEIKSKLEDCIRLDTMVHRDEQYARRMEKTVQGLLLKVGEIVADVNSSSLLYTAIKDMYQDANIKLEKSKKMIHFVEKCNAKVERDIEETESRVSVLQGKMKNAMRQRRWQQGQIRQIEGQLNTRMSRIPQLYDAIQEIDEAIQVEEDRIQDCSQCLLPLAHSMIVHARQEEDVRDAKNREYAAQIVRSTRELNEMRLYIHQIQSGLEEQQIIIRQREVKSAEPSATEDRRQQHCEHALDRLYEMLRKHKEEMQSRVDDLVYTQMVVSHGIQELDQAIDAVEHEIDAGNAALLQMEREYECICRENNAMHAFCMSLSTIPPYTEDADSMKKRKIMLQDNIRHLKEDIVQIENTMYNRLLQYQSLQDAAQDASNTTSTQMKEGKIHKTPSFHQMTNNLQYTARRDAREAHRVQKQLPRLISSMVSRIGSNAAQL